MNNYTVTEANKIDLTRGLGSAKSVGLKIGIVYNNPSLQYCLYKHRILYLHT